RDCERGCRRDCIPCIRRRGVDYRYQHSRGRRIKAMSQTKQEKNKALVLEALDTLFNRRDYAAAERFWSPSYIQHSAHIAPGRAGLSTLVKRLPPRPAPDVRPAPPEADWSKPVPYQRDEPRVGRNDPCPCGSGKKFNAEPARAAGPQRRSRRRGSFLDPHAGKPPRLAPGTGVPSWPGVATFGLVARWGRGQAFSTTGSAKGTCAAIATSQVRYSGNALRKNGHNRRWHCWLRHGRALPGGVTRPQAPAQVL